MVAVIYSLSHILGVETSSVSQTTVIHTHLPNAAISSYFYTMSHLTFILTFTPF